MQVWYLNKYVSIQQNCFNSQNFVWMMEIVIIHLPGYSHKAANFVFEAIFNLKHWQDMFRLVSWASRGSNSEHFPCFEFWKAIIRTALWRWIYMATATRVQQLSSIRTECCMFTIKFMRTMWLWTSVRRISRFQIRDTWWLGSRP